MFSEILCNAVFNGNRCIQTEIHAIKHLCKVPNRNGHTDVACNIGHMFAHNGFKTVNDKRLFCVRLQLTGSARLLNENIVCVALADFRNQVVSVNNLRNVEFLCIQYAVLHPVEHLVNLFCLSIKVIALLGHELLVPHRQFGAKIGNHLRIHLDELCVLACLFDLSALNQIRVSNQNTGIRHM